MEIISVVPGSASEIIAIVTVAIAAIGIGIRKLHSMWANDGTHIRHAETETRLYTILREQLDRFEQQNKDLRDEIRKLEHHNRELLGENQKIVKEIQDLKTENASLRDMLLDLEAKVSRL